MKLLKCAECGYVYNVISPANRGCPRCDRLRYRTDGDTTPQAYMQTADTPPTYSSPAEPERSSPHESSHSSTPSSNDNGSSSSDSGSSGSSE